jgi:hypothetical protein
MAMRHEIEFCLHSKPKYVMQIQGVYDIKTIKLKKIVIGFP